MLMIGVIIRSYAACPQREAHPGTLREIKSLGDAKIPWIDYYDMSSYSAQYRRAIVETDFVANAHDTLDSHGIIDVAMTKTLHQIVSPARS
jgi:hypothetical protein